MEIRDDDFGLEDIRIQASDLVHLARLAVEGGADGAQALVARVARKVREVAPKTYRQLTELGRARGGSGLFRSTSRQSNGGQSVASMPVDVDTRLELARFEYPVELPAPPILSANLGLRLHQLIVERKRESELRRAKLLPSRSALFTGQPGVGKTLAARWIARELDVPLVVLDLAAVMSSFLGRTGNNVRHVLDYARGSNCVLLLDEFDAIAKRRDDVGELGELKRLVTVLLQEIDDWPASGLLVAATNHPNLLDPAVWRRFDMVLEFPLPGTGELNAAAMRQIQTLPNSEQLAQLLAAVYVGASFSDLERDLVWARRQAVVLREPLEDRLYEVIQQRLQGSPRSVRHEIASVLTRSGMSQREVHRVTGVSRDTLRKARGLS